MPSPLRDGGGTPADPRLHSPVVTLRLYHRHPHLLSHSTVSDHKISRFYVLIHLPRFAAFCFSLVAIVFNASNSSASWLGFHPFRLVFLAYAVIGIYFVVKLCAWMREDLRGTTLPPELVQLRSDFAHDQLFAYLALSAGVVGAMTARGLGRCSAGDPDPSIALQAYISIALGFAGFGFLAISAVVSGFHIAFFVLAGSLFPPLVSRTSAVDASRCESQSAATPRADVRNAI